MVVKGIREGNPYGQFSGLSFNSLPFQILLLHTLRHQFALGNLSNTFLNMVETKIGLLVAGLATAVFAQTYEATTLDPLMDIDVENTLKVQWSSGEDKIHQVMEPGENWSKAGM
jgi:hypothetical protein